MKLKELFEFRYDNLPEIDIDELSLDGFEELKKLKLSVTDKKKLEELIRVKELKSEWSQHTVDVKNRLKKSFIFFQVLKSDSGKF